MIEGRAKPMPISWKQTTLPWILLTAFALGLFSFRIGSYPLTDRDETLYSEVARECLDTGDWLTLHWQRKPWFIHAPLAMWIEAAGFALLGVSEGTARLPSVLFGTGLVLLTTALGQMLFGRRVGFAAGLILATSPLFFMIARMAILDMTFAFFVTLAVYIFVRASHHENRRLYPAFWLAAGLATLSKGLWGCVLPCMVCFLYAMTGARWHRLLDWRLYLSASAWGVVVLPWLIAGTLRHGREFLSPVLVTNTYARLTSVICEHHGPWWYYLPILVVGFFPWIVLWPSALIRRHGAEGRLLLAWILPALILFSSARTKLPNYILPLSPAIAIALACGVMNSRGRCAQGIALPILGAAIGYGVARGLRDFDVLAEIGSPIPVTVAIAVGYTAAGIALLARRSAAPAISAAFLGVVLLMIPIGYAKVAHELAPKQLALEARSLAGNGPVFTANRVTCQDGIYFYCGEPFRVTPSVVALADEVRRARSDCTVILSAGQLQDVRKTGLRLKVIARNQKWVVAQAVGL